MKEEVERLQRSEVREVYCESPRNITSYAHDALPARLPKRDLNQDDRDRHANVDEGKLSRPQILHKQLQATKDTENKRNTSPGTSTLISEPIPNGQP